MPCSTVALAPTEPVAKSSLDRVRCGAPLRFGEDHSAGPRQKVKRGFTARRKNRDFSPSSSHLRAPERRISWKAWGSRWPGIRGDCGVPSIRRAGGLRVDEFPQLYVCPPPPAQLPQHHVCPSGSLRLLRTALTGATSDGEAVGDAGVDFELDVHFEDIWAPVHSIRTRALKMSNSAPDLGIRCFSCPRNCRLPIITLFTSAQV